MVKTIKFKAVLEQLPISDEERQEKPGLFAKSRFVPIGRLARLSKNHREQVYNFMNYQLNLWDDEFPTGTIVRVRMKEHKTPSGYTEYVPSKRQGVTIR